MISRAGHNIEYDPVNDEMWHANPEAQAILVFRGAADGEEAPIRVIQGPHTRLAFPNYGIGVDAVNNEVFVVDKEYILVYPRTAKGDVTPIREIKGPDTQLINARAIIVDTARNVLVVGTNNGLVLFDRNADGNAKPRAVIAGPISGIRTSKSAGTATQADLELRRRGNIGSAIQSMRESPKGYLVAIVGGRDGRGADDEENDTGAAEAAEGRSGSRAGRGPGGGPGGIAAWKMDDFLRVAGHGDVSPVWVLTDPKGGFGAGRIALNPNNKEVILGGNKIVMYSYPEIF